jgi:hypothetical protein
MIPRNAEPFIAARDIRRAELRRQEAARRRDGVRGETEFWEEDFSELPSRSRARSST